MITLYIKEFLKIRGFEPKTQTLFKWGISYQAASRLLNNNVKTISFKNLELLCVAMDCTPNDLFNYKPLNSKVPPTLEIHKLNKKEQPTSLADYSKTLKPKQMQEAIKAIEDIIKKV